MGGRDWSSIYSKGSDIRCAHVDCMLVELGCVAGRIKQSSISSSRSHTNSLRRCCHDSNVVAVRGVVMVALWLI